jgi:hypothetical protein
LGANHGDVDHDRVERKGERKIGDHPDCYRDQVVAGTTDGYRRCAGVGAVFQRDAVEYRPGQKRAEQDDRAEVAIGCAAA